MSSYTQPCEYEQCQCTVSGGLEGANYCSDICASRDGTDEELEVNCECGHPPCDASD